MPLTATEARIKARVDAVWLMPARTALDRLILITLAFEDAELSVDALMKLARGSRRATARALTAMAAEGLVCEYVSLDGRTFELSDEHVARAARSGAKGRRR